MPLSSTKCTQSGIYQTTCRHKLQIALSKGDTFPPCRQCSEQVNWVLIKATEN